MAWSPTCQASLAFTLALESEGSNTAAWRVFASLFIAITIVARNLIPALGENAITGAFMISNLIAIIALGLYLGIKGTREFGYQS